MSVQGSKQTVSSGLLFEVDAINPKSYSTGNLWYDLTGFGNSVTRNSSSIGYSGSYFDYTLNDP